MPASPAGARASATPSSPRPRRRSRPTWGPWFIGKDATDINALHREAAQAFHIFGRNGPVVYAHSAIDIALWDIAGKRAGLPLCDLLGGARRKEVRAYASLMRYASPATVGRICAEMVERGFRHIKLHEHSVDAVKAAREGAGPDIAIMNDVNCPWTRGAGHGDGARLQALPTSTGSRSRYGRRRTTTGSPACAAAARRASPPARTRPACTTSTTCSRRARSTSPSRA